MGNVCAAAWGGAGLSWALGQAVLPDMGATTGQRYDAVAAARGAESLSAALLVVASVLLVLGALSVARRAPSGRLIAVGTALTAIGGVWLAGGRAAFNMVFFRLTDPDVPRGVAVTALDAAPGVGFVPLLLTLPALLLGPILLALGLRSVDRAAWAALALWVVGIGMFAATEFAVKATEVVGIGLAALALGLLGRLVDRHAAVRVAAVTSPEGAAANW